MFAQLCGKLNPERSVALHRLKFGLHLLLERDERARLVCRPDLAVCGHNVHVGTGTPRVRAGRTDSPFRVDEGQMQMHCRICGHANMRESLQSNAVDHDWTSGLNYPDVLRVVQSLLARGHVASSLTRFARLSFVNAIHNFSNYICTLQIVVFGAKYGKIFSFEYHKN